MSLNLHPIILLYLSLTGMARTPVGCITPNHLRHERAHSYYGEGWPRKARKEGVSSMPQAKKKGMSYLTPLLNDCWTNIDIVDISVHPCNG